ncbi:two-component system OmpR family response regulator [Caulobacter ginsengisoli]|uniref:Two-component system OmpR family response regulator n=1 Tax=Caulobacter ginsengisoli TaxID=400775 RepID=A0ABU0IRM0_9CAUL|nr:response regulator [Caulobacter ginsengisoli]MDQ0464629.1 two-component system OmpR family response regulator [Caulobacter ginsengisoli]
MRQLEARKQLIFVADDDRMILDLIVTRLQLAGYLTAHARSGYEAIHGIAEIRPAGVILDVNMPGLDGFSVLKQLKQTPQTASIPVMMLTARNAPDDVQKAIGLGARDFLAKPFSDTQLLSRVARLVRPVRPRPVTPPPGPTPKPSGGEVLL